MAGFAGGGSGFGALARGAAFYVLLFAWTIGYGVLVIPLLLAPRAVVLAAARLWNRGAMDLVTSVAGIGYAVRGAENIPDEPAIIAVKHQSAFETLALPLILGDPLFVLKRELLWIPLFGWYLARLGNIGIDRGAGTPALRAIVRESGDALKAGHHVVIFPEGTRVAPGQTRPYGPGVAALYTMLKVPVVPVALNSGLFWGRRRWGKRTGKVVIAFLPAIRPGLERDAFVAELARRIETVTGRLMDEATGRAPAHRDAP
jgi:1-acyl-sn-glycerol-3-phosphate acyltransferase